MRSKGYIEKLVETEIFCEACGKQIVSARKTNRKYCAECQLKRKKEAIKKYKERIAKTQPPKKQKSA